MEESESQSNTCADVMDRVLPMKVKEEKRR